MRKLSLAVLTLVVLGALYVGAGAQDVMVAAATPAKQQAPACSMQRPAMVLRHVVLFKFKDDITPEAVREIENAFAALPSKVEAIYDFEWGTDVSVENLADGFTHCFTVTFKSEADRAAYLPHPAHKEFGALLRKDNRLDKVLVLDYWTQY